MKQLEQFQEQYAAYQEKRTESDMRCAKNMMIWAVLLVPAFALAVWILMEMEWWSDGGQMIGCFTLMFLATWAICMPRGVLGSHNRYVNWITFDFSAKLMAHALEDKLGSSTVEPVKYPVMQSKADATTDVARNQRQAWMKKGEEFLLHRVRLTETDSEDNTVTLFEGMVFSVRVDPLRWGCRNTKEDLKKLAATWEKELFINGRKPEFSLDRFEDKYWLSAGYSKLTLGEEDIPWQDLEHWYDHCRKETQVVLRVRDVLRQIALTG